MFVDTGPLCSSSICVRWRTELSMHCSVYLYKLKKHMRNWRLDRLPRIALIAACRQIRSSDMLHRTIFRYAAMAVAAGAILGFDCASAVLALEIAPLSAPMDVAPTSRTGYVRPSGYRMSSHPQTWAGGDYLRDRHAHYWVADHWGLDSDRWRHERDRSDHD